MALDVKDKAGLGATAPVALAWPAALPEQVRSVALVLAAGATVLTLTEIERRFKGRGPWKRSLPRILEALGRAQRDGGGWRR